MSMEYSYSVSSDTLNGQVSTRALDKQIRSNGLIPIELVGVLVHVDRLKVIFKTSLSSDQVVQLNNIVLNHDGVPPKKPARYNTRSDGVLRVVQEPSDSANLMQIKGFGFAAVAPKDVEESPKKTEYDLVLPGTVDIQGIHSLGVIGDVHDDDYVDIAVVFPAGSSQQAWTKVDAGNWPFEEQTTAPSDVEIMVFGSQVRLLKAGIQPILADGTRKLVPPLVVRFSYFAHGVGAPLKVRGNVRWWIFTE